MRSLAAGLLMGLLFGAYVWAYPPAPVVGATPRLLTCPMYVTGSLRTQLDAGPYVSLATVGWMLPDAGGPVATWPAGAERVGDTSCTLAADCVHAVCADGGVAIQQPECACSSGTGCNTVGGPDGGSTAALVGETLPAGSFSGAGCVRKVCTVLSGVPEAWPVACPTGGQ